MNLNLEKIVEKGYKCKTCELFPPLGTTSGQSRLKFGQEAVKNLTDHPTHYFRGHGKSHKHQNAIEQYEGISNNNLLHFLVVNKVVGNFRDFSNIEFL